MQLPVEINLRLAHFHKGSISLSIVEKLDNHRVECCGFAINKSDSLTETPKGISSLWNATVNFYPRSIVVIFKLDLEKNPGFTAPPPGFFSLKKT